MNIRLTVLLALLTGLSACFRGGAPVHFYMLEPIAADRSVSGVAVPTQAPLIGLGPIRIPAYLDRPQIVTALANQEYRIAEDQRWAERLDETVTRVLAENLSNLIPTERIVFHPWQGAQKPDVQISATIQEFHADASGQVRLNAIWTLKGADSGPVQRKFTCRQPAPAGDYARITAAQSACLSVLSRAMADAVRALPLTEPAKL